MSVISELRIYSPVGDPVVRTDEFIDLSVSMGLNRPGLLSVRLPADSDIPASLEHRSQVEYWEADPENGIAWRRVFGALFLRHDWSAPDGVRRDEINCPGYLWMLGTRIIAYYANTANRTKFTGQPAETIMKTLVSYNATASATTGNGRIRDGTNWPASVISVQADGGSGASLDWFCAWENLLENLQKLAPVAGGDFDLVKTGANAFEFRFYPGQRGADRSADVVFALERGNMAQPAGRTDRTAERTVAVVGGQGEESARHVETVTGDDYAAGNDIEVFVEATNANTAGGLQSAGLKELKNRRAVRQFAFDVLQTPACLYGKHYDLGDLVTAVNPYDGSSSVLKVRGVTIALAEGGKRTVSVEVGTP